MIPRVNVYYAGIRSVGEAEWCLDCLVVELDEDWQLFSRSIELRSNGDTLLKRTTHNRTTNKTRNNVRHNVQLPRTRIHEVALFEFNILVQRIFDVATHHNRTAWIGLIACYKHAAPMFRFFNASKQRIVEVVVVVVVV